MTNHSFQVHHAGDTALVVEFGDKVAAPINAMVLDLSDLIDAQAIPGVIETVPTFRSLLVHYDPDVIGAQDLLARLERLTPTSTRRTSGQRLWQLPVCYEGEFAMDLAAVATQTGLSCEQVVTQHTQTTYDVFMLGFLPGQPYLGELPEVLRLPRRTSPRLRIPAGSVGIATSLTCIYPSETPCGWHIIGRTPVPMWNLQSAGRPVFAPGDRIALQAISSTTYRQLVDQIAADAFRLLPLDSEAPCQPH